MNTTAKVIESGWKCETCGRAGTIEYPADVDVYGAIQRLEAAHDAQAKGLCSARLGTMHVWPISPVSSPEETLGRASEEDQPR
jgi:hypothetical protein